MVEPEDKPEPEQEAEGLTEEEAQAQGTVLAGIVTADIYQGKNITPGPVDMVGAGRRKHRRGLR